LEGDLPKLRRGHHLGQPAEPVPEPLLVRTLQRQANVNPSKPKAGFHPNAPKPGASG
jgi:hypothetical protein